MLLLGALCMLLPLFACATGPAAVPGRDTIRLTDLFERAEKTLISGGIPLERALSRGSEKLEGRTREVIRQNPGGRLAYSLRIPADAVLRFGHCMAPHTWRQSPDGARFHVRARRIRAGGNPGRPLELFSTALDPKQNPGHRRIFEQQVDLSRLGGSSWELIFTLGHGPRKNVEWDTGFWIEPRIEYPSGLVDPAPQDRRRPDILLVTLDGLRADVLPAFTDPDVSGGPATATVPLISRLAAEGLRASAAHTPSTLFTPACASILTGGSPADHGLHREGDRARASLPTIAEHLTDRGYRTAAFLGTSRLAARRTTLARGFETWSCPPAGRRPVRETAITLVDWFRRGDGRPSFCWLQISDLQPPLPLLRQRDRRYYPRGGYNRWDESILRLLPHFVRRPDLGDRWYRWLHDVTTTGYVEACYLGEVDRVDRQLGRVVEELRALGRLDNTVIVVTATRGLALGDRGIFYTGESLLPGVTRVPLIFHAPGRIPAARLPRRAACSTADILPTLLGLLPPDPVEVASVPPGYDLRAALRDTTALERRPLFIEGHVGPVGRPNRFALLAGGLKLVESTVTGQGTKPGSDGVEPWSRHSDHQFEALYDRLGDPVERKNLHGTRPLITLQHRMHRHLRSMIPPEPAR